MIGFTGLRRHDQCVSTHGCSWLRTLVDGGRCRSDPVTRCLGSSSPECECSAHDFHGEGKYNADLELFVPLSVTWANLAPATSLYGGVQKDHYTLQYTVEQYGAETLENFTARTDFTKKQLKIKAALGTTGGKLAASAGMSLTFKFMRVWDDAAIMDGQLFRGFGVYVGLVDGYVVVRTIGDSAQNVRVGEAKKFQCNSFSLTITQNSDAIAYHGGVTKTIKGLRMSTVAAFVAAKPLDMAVVGKVNAKIWDLRVYGNGRVLTAAEVAEVGKRCGAKGEYSIPTQYPESNKRYSYGMGGWKINPDHNPANFPNAAYAGTQGFASGVYVTLWIPYEDTWPPTDPQYIENLQRLIGFWDRTHEQVLFEMDFAPFVDMRELQPEGSHNFYRKYSSRPGSIQETSNYKNPCRFVTDLFQAHNYIPQDWCDPGNPSSCEATSADHRKIAERTYTDRTASPPIVALPGWSRWPEHSNNLLKSWQRPVHEHGHTMHFTSMRVYNTVGTYMRGIGGESYSKSQMIKSLSLFF